MARQLTTRFTQALPGVVAEDPAEARGRRDRVVDTAMYVFAIVVGAATLPDTWEEHPTWLRVVAIVVGIATVVSLRWRKTDPGPVGIGIGAVALVILTASGALVVATFNAAIRARGRDLAIVVALAIGWAFLNPVLYPPDGSYLFDAGASLLMAAVAVGWGLFVRARRALVQSLRDQAERAGDEARAAERRRIAREMHDVLAHRLSLRSVHAGALEFRPDAPPEEIAEAASVIRDSARAALDDLRGVIGILREDGGESFTEPPQPTIADLPALVEESRRAGMRLTAEIELGDAAPQVEIRSLAPVAVPPASQLPGAGTGLIGLAERVTLAGGELESGVDPAGAFVLRASLPR
jgi:signal transduction histidine kinase